MTIRRFAISLVVFATCLMCATPGFARVFAGSFYQQDTGLSFGFQGSNRADNVEITFGDYPAPHHIEDQGGVLAYSECVPDSETAATCHNYLGHYQGRLAAGNDDVKMSGEFDGILYAGAGADLVATGAGADEIYGSRGADRISGGPNADLIDGGPAPDDLRGAAGDDKLRAADGSRDQRIDCGPGHDFARIDRNLDPRPRHCEDVLSIG